MFQTLSVRGDYLFANVEQPSTAVGRQAPGFTAARTSGSIITFTSSSPSITLASGDIVLRALISAPSRGQVVLQATVVSTSFVDR